jgi:small multidrug resistance pump
MGHVPGVALAAPLPGPRTCAEMLRASERQGCRESGMGRAIQLDMAPYYALLGCAVAFEAAWAVLLKFSRGFTVLWPSLAMAVAYLASLACLNLACKRLDLSFAYPVWTGLGGALVALIGVLAFKEPFGTARALGVAFVCVGVGLLLGFAPRAAEGG